MHASDLEAMISPIEQTTVTIGDDLVPAFSITGEASAVGDNVENMLADIELMKESYQDVIEAILSNIEALDDMLMEEGDISLFGFAETMAEGWKRWALIFLNCQNIAGNMHLGQNKRTMH